MSLNRIVFEKINDQFGWGQYGEFRVLIRVADNYINATKLCADGGKRFDNWLRLDGSKSLMEELRTSLDVRKFPTSVTEEVKSYGETRGTYVHPELVPHIASWISAQFAIKVSQIVNEYIIREYEWELAKRQGTINTLENKVDSLFVELKQANQTLDQTRTELGQAHRLIQVMSENMVETMGNLGMVSRQRVPTERMDDKEREQLVLLHLEDQKYKVIRAQKRAVYKSISIQRAKYPNLRQVLVIDDHPNPVELWNAIKQRLKADGIDVKANDVLNNERGEDYLVALFQIRDYEKFKVFENQRERVISTHVEFKQELADKEEEKQGDKETPDDEQDSAYEQRVRELLQYKNNELKEMCRTRKLTGWSKLNKTKLVHFIASHDQ